MNAYMVNIVQMPAGGPPAYVVEIVPLVEELIAAQEYRKIPIISEEADA